MALGSSRYLDPGVYISQKIQPGSVAVTSERVACLVGLAPRTKRQSNEAVVRGGIFEEALSAWTSSTPYRCVLAKPSNRDRNQARLLKNGVEVALGSWSFVSAFLSGDEWAGATVNVSVLDNLTLSIDGKVPVTINFNLAPIGVIANTAAATDAELVAWINYELGNAAGSHYAKYGTAYASVASATAGAANPIIHLTSPSTTSASDVKVFRSFENDAASVVSNTAWAPSATEGVQASTYVEVSDSAFSSSATWEIDYVSITTLADSLEEATSTTPLSDIVRAGSYPGAAGYTKDTDYEVAGNTIDWDVSGKAAASFTGVTQNFAIVLNTNDRIKISVNGITPLEIQLTPGGARTAAQVAADINAALVASALYGPLYGHVASSTTSVVLTAPSPFPNYPTVQDAASSITLYGPSNSAMLTVFGLAAASLPSEVFGVGSKPSFGATYYTSYDYDRPATDYQSAWRVYNADQLYAYTSPLTDENYTVNHLAIAGEIAFEQGAPSLWVCQINDSTAAGMPTQSQIQAAIDVCAEKYGITEVVVVAPPAEYEEALAVYTMNHVANMSSQFEKKYRRGWFGMPRKTSVGDPDTPDTFVYRAKRTLQPGNTSPGRGRLILCSPSEVSRTLVLEDASEVTVELDGSYLAVANAALYTSLPGPADPMLGRLLTGFLTDDTFETYLQGERYTLASSGVNVATLDAGRIVLLDPLTTEAGGSVEFQEPSSSAQKDSVTKAIDTLLDQNCKGIVPDSLAIFIVTIKSWISRGIEAAIQNGTIAPYRNASGAIRPIDPSTDIQVFKDPTDPRTYTFKYWFNLRYVAKRFFGEYSVDNPFVSN